MRFGGGAAEPKGGRDLPEAAWSRERKGAVRLSVGVLGRAMDLNCLRGVLCARWSCWRLTFRSDTTRSGARFDAGSTFTRDAGRSLLRTQPVEQEGGSRQGATLSQFVFVPHGYHTVLYFPLEAARMNAFSHGSALYKKVWRWRSLGHCAIRRLSCRRVAPAALCCGGR